MSEEIVTATGVLEDTAPKKKIKDMTPEEKKEYQRNAVAKHRREKKQDDSSRRWNCTSEISEKDAREILTEDRGLRNPRVIEVCLKLAELAARELRLPYNRYMFTHGIQKQLESRANKATAMGQPPDVEDKWYLGSTIRRHEEYALYDFGMSWRETNGKKYTFEEFLAMRRTAIVDTYEFGKIILGKDFWPEPHGRWAEELFVRKNPDLLPEVFDWEDIKKAFAGQSDIHQRVLISSRSSYKSSYVLCELLSWVLCFAGNLRIMTLSATKPLSSGFLQAFRAYWTYKTAAPTLFNQIYPEFMMFPNELKGTTEFISPMRTIDLIQPTYFPVSLDSEGLAGERCDLLVAEDVAEINNSATPEQREKTLTKFDMLCELVEPFGQQIIVGTPISSGSGTEDDPGDIYSVLLKRESERTEKRMLSMICPCWTVKEGVNKKPFDKSLMPEEVDLLFPSRLTFKILMGKLKDNEKVFRQQSLCSWVPDSEDGPKIHFVEEELRRAHMPRDQAPRDGGGAFTILTADLALTSARTSDGSAFAAVRISPTPEGKWRMTVLEVEFGRFKMSELALKIVLFRKKYPECRNFYIERISGTELLQREVHQLAYRYEISMAGIHWATPDMQRDAKHNRLLGLQILLEDPDRLLRFISGSWTDELMTQFMRVSTFRRNAQGQIRFKGVDIADAISMAARFIPGQPLDEKQQRDRDAEDARNRMLAQHAAMFGTDFTPPLQPQQQQEPELTQQQKNRALLGRCLPPGMRY